MKKVWSVGVTLLGILLVGQVLAGDNGDITVDTRLRYETADIDGLQSADNLSIRLRLGYTTPEWNGFKAMVEGEFTGVSDEGSYNAAGVHGDASKSVIADPKNAELDQAFVAYETEDLSLKLGRQVITLDNHRFVGHVGWRQNRQTYDAASLRFDAAEKLSLFYAYVDNVVRIFGSEAPNKGGNAGEADADSHLMNASYKVCKGLTLTVYAYLLDLDDVPAVHSVDSYGASAKGSVEANDDLSFGYYFEYAYQEDAGSNPLDYEADYFHLLGDTAYKGLSGEVGYEVLGAEDTGAVDAMGAPIYGSFQTPLATLHKFNGFADRFLATPAKGLEDFYVSLGYKLKLSEKAGPLLAKVTYHDFNSSERNDDLGDEWDAVLIKPLKIDAVPGDIKLIAKYAAYSKGDVGADTDRFIFEINYAQLF